MDDDKKIIKVIKKNIKNIHFSIEYLDKKIPTEEVGNERIRSLIQVGKPAAVMRLGSTETNCAYPWMVGKEPSEDVLKRGMYLSGIFPGTSRTNADFSKTYLESAKYADIMGLCDVYKERKIINRYCTNAQFIKARSIEPYYYEHPWSYALKGKRILIVHPFVETISKQYEKRKYLFQNPEILPEFADMQFVKTVQSAAGAKTEFETWNDALDYMLKEIDKKTYDIAIVGAGAYAMPLCAHIKMNRKIAIQMSGATQLLFGIKGKRWDDHPIISHQSRRKL